MVNNVQLRNICVRLTQYVNTCRLSEWYYGIVGFNVPLDTLGSIGHFGDESRLSERIGYITGYS